MGETYLGEISLGAFNFAPHGFALCNGQVLSISQNTALFSLLGTNFGGDGQSTFELPNLQGRVPIHFGQSAGTSQYVIGQTGGVETVTLTQNQIPAHSHLVNVNAAAGTTATPGTTTYLAAGPPTGSGPNATMLDLYTTNASTTTLNAATIANTGGSQPHSILQPFLVVTYVIALQGIFPSRN
jgi:microcystin-dependent protein